ncbi:hypothetical protein Tco_0908519 [Tanacetum coccineum]|uniref:Uncharacterized protein n=1 Tax=Tanacetum coccineum TaxID=301880 RepID=A0ABQ5CTT6_9ASTR
MASLDRHLNPLYAIKECSSCGNLHTKNCGWSIESLEDKILVPIPDLSQRPLKIKKNCLDCRDPVHGLYCRQCALIRKTLEEVFQDFQDTSESSDDDTNFVNQEPFVVKQGPDSCGKGAHIGFNCPTKVSIISKPEPCNNQTVNEFPQTLPSVHPTSCSRDENSFTYDSKPNFVDDSPNVFNPPPQPPMYSCKFCGNDARYGHYCTPQVLFIYPEPCYNQDFNFPQDFHDFQQQYLCCENCEGPQETFQCQPMNEDYYEQDYCYDPNSFEGRRYDDDKDYTIAITPVSSTKEPVSSLSMGDEHLDTISGKRNSTNVCDVPLCNNPTTLEAFKEHSETIIDSNHDYSSSDDDYFSSKDIEYVDASPPDAEIVSLEVVEIVIPEVGGIDDDILLTIKDDILRVKLLNVNLLIANIEALKDNPAPSSDVMTKSSSTSLNLFLEETNTFDNSLSEFETFRFDLEENSSGSTTTLSDYSLLDYKTFYDHIKDKSSGSTTTQSDISLSQYDSFIFDLLIDSFPPADGSDFYHEEFADELAHMISPPSMSVSA